MEGLLSLVAVGIVLVVFRISFMGNTPPEFAPADNPASDSESLLTRTLTFLYLPVLNFWLLLYPGKLSDQHNEYTQTLLHHIIVWHLLGGKQTSKSLTGMNSMKLVIPLHFISRKKTPNDAVTPQRQSQFTPKMKANAVPRLLSSLV